MSKILIGLHGPKRSGKDTAGTFLLESLAHCGLPASRYAFATPILKMVRSLVCETFGFDRDEFERIAQSDAKDTFVFPGIGATYRQLAMSLGCEWGRDHIHPGLWLNAARTFITSQSGAVVVTDVRMPDEAALIRELGGVVLHIIRPGTRCGGGHRSEDGLSVHPGDFVVCNDGTLEDFQDKLVLFLIATLRRWPASVITPTLQSQQTITVG